MNTQHPEPGLIGKIIRYPWALIFVAVILAFPAVAVFMGWRAAAMLMAWQEARGWVETPATIEHLELQIHDGGEGTTYDVDCRYSYVFSGQTFQGTRVGLAEGSDNIGSWQRTTYERLRKHHEGLESDPVSCWVNPDNPQEAVLDRELRWGLFLFHLLFVVVFGGIGLAFALVPVWWRWGSARLQSLQARYPDQPWRWKAEWAEGRLKPRGPGPALWLLAVFWNLVSVPVAAIFVLGGMREKRLWPLALLCFPLVGVGLLAAAIVQSRRYRRFRGSRLELHILPGVIGGPLRGTLHLAGDLTGIGDVELALQCVRTFVTRRGGESETRQEVLWEEKRSVPTGGTTFGITELGLPVDFSIPHGCRPTHETEVSDTVRWRLTARAALPGADLDLKFDVPVFRTADSRPPGDQSPAGRGPGQAVADGPDWPPGFQRGGCLSRWILLYCRGTPAPVHAGR